MQPKNDIYVKLPAFAANKSSALRHANKAYSVGWF